MFLIAGLGNPGRQYEKTRHNMGFDTIDELIDRHRIPQGGIAHKAMYGKGMIAGEKVLAVKPLTYMNLSGESLRECVNYYKLDPETQMIVIYDDIDLEPGQIRIRKKGSAGGHNGIKSIIAQLGTQNFYRIKVGVGAKPKGWDLADYVLGRFSSDERIAVDKAIEEAADAVEMILKDGIEAAMNHYNRKNKQEQQE
ncbi:MAG: aminoacyl-tRNA hydrolase [Blautia sp.]|uniref:aminoacyl-tRNA hydrolase n=1 Tax=Blautia sp. TaxID=1955243 RepID=UPI002E77D3DF|nr:aminoacyl-tRNA hydrolase [Blautia sp.]MEE1444894.1 aminoacyl-tRNA hydrolase [Blautia sp.]